MKNVISNVVNDFYKILEQIDFCIDANDTEKAKNLIGVYQTQLQEFMIKLNEDDEDSIL